MLSWVCLREAGAPTFEFLCYLDVPGDVVRKELFEDGDLIVFTDGSLSDQKLGFSFVIYREADCISPVFEYNAILTSRKTILDAEVKALVGGLGVVLALPYSGKIFLISNCRTALRILSASPAPGPRSHLISPMKRLLDSRCTVFAAWIKGHSGHQGNHRTDTLANTASVASDPFPGTSHSYMSLHLSTATSTELLAWFNCVSHHYHPPPRHSAKHHRHLTRLKSSVLFCLCANKGWSPGDNVVTTPPPPCQCDLSSARDGVHLTVCPATYQIRPPDVGTWIHQDARCNLILRWAARHRYFSVALPTSQVRWISLSQPGYLVPTRHHTCDICH